MSRKFTRHGQKWSLEEDNQLWQEYLSNVSIKEISNNHKRPETAIKSRIKLIVQKNTPDCSPKIIDDKSYHLYLYMINSNISLEDICKLFFWQIKDIDRFLYQKIQENQADELAKERLYNSLTNN